MSNCENCCYWRRIKAKQQKEVAETYNWEHPMEWGNCHRYPPTRVWRTDDAGRSETGYPETSDSDWCGEWSESEER